MESELGRVVDALPGFVWTALPDGQIDFMNQRWSEYTGLAVDRSRGSGWQAAVHPEDLVPLLATWRGAATPNGPVEAQVRLRGANGNYRWFSFRAHPVCDASGRIVKWAGLSSDIDDRMQAEDALRASEGRFRQIVDELPVLLSTATPDGGLDQANRHYLEYFGATLEELKAQQAPHNLHPDDRARVNAARMAAIATGRPYEIECRRRRADGVYRWFYLRAFPLRDSEGSIRLWYRLQIDIEEQKQAEAVLTGEKQLLEMVAGGRSMAEILAGLCGLVETAARGCYCSIVLLDPSGTKLEQAIAPSLAPDFNDSVRGWPLDRVGGPCVMAARDKVQVIMSDVASDARWRNSWRKLAQAHGLRSCWSTPIVSRVGKVLGTFALYQREPASPSAPQLDLIAQFTNIASIAIEHAQRDSALRQSEAQLSKAQRELQLMIDTIPAFVTVFRPDGEREYVNKTWRDNTGLELADIQNGGWRRIVHPDDQERSDRLWREAVATGVPLTIEQRIRRHDGEYRWHMGRRVPLRDDSGNVVRWYSVAIDIEDQKRAEQALRQSEARLALAERELQLTIDSIPMLVAAYEPDGTRIFVNRTWLDYSGLSHEGAMKVDRTGSSLVHPDDVERFSEEWRVSLASGTPLRMELRLRRADGEYRWHAMQRVLARDEPGAIVKWYSVAIDIEERKRAEEALRASERNSRLIVDSIPGLVAIFTPEGEVERVNRQLLEYFGRTMEELQHWGTGDAAHPEDLPRIKEVFARSIASGEPFDFEVRARRFDGAYRWFQSRGLPLRDINGRIVRWYNLLIDIDERKHAEEALRQSEGRLAVAERELRVTLDSIPTITWRGAPNGYVQQLNKRWFEYTGTTPEQVRGWRWKLCVHPDDLDGLVGVGSNYVASGEAIDCEARLRRHDGTYRWFLFRPAPARDESGKIIGWYGSITDIEDRKRAEEKALEAERELQRTIDNIPVLVGTYSADGTRLSVNKRALEATGLSARDVPGEGWRTAFHPDEVDAIERHWRACLASGEPFERENRRRAPDGTYRWYLTRRVPLRDEAGKIIRWYSIGYDIEDQKRAEEALSASERNLKLTIDTIPTVAWSARPDGSADFFNKNYLDYVGLSFEQVQGWGWTVAVHPDDLTRLAMTWQALMAAGAPGEAEARLRRRDGEYRWFLFRASPLRDDAGNIIKWYGINTDIEDRKRAEEELRRSEAFLAKGQQASLTGTFSWDPATGKYTWSEELYRIYDFQVGVPVTLEMIGARYHPEDKHLLDEMAARGRNGATDFDYEHRLLMPSGAIKYVHVVAHAGRDEDGHPLEHFGAVQDITQRRVAEVALDKARSELAHVTRVMTLGALTASIAHEVNQPLAGIVMNASTCLRMLAADPPNIDGARETARRTIRDGNRAADVITRLRALFSNKAGAAETIDLNDATREVLALVFSDLLRNRVVLRAELDDDHPLLVTADRVQLQQVILNLVRNASDAMSGVNDRPRNLLVKAWEDDDGARLSVRDAGVGLDPQSAERLFDAFFTTKSDGMGIGLSVSRSIIESHGGRLWAEPNEGAGATFSFSIPRQATSAEDEGTAGAIFTRPMRGANGLMRNAE
jgi:PAS domain S-box-containing protein